MATGTGEHYGNTLTTASGASSARYYAHITKVVFNESTGVSTVTYNLGLQVTRGDFYGSRFQNYGAWTNSYQVYGVGYYGYHDNLTFTCAHNSSEHFYDGAGYTSASSGYLSSTIDFYWYPTLPKYTIAYNANGGSGAPASQSKTWGTAITLSSSAPTRTGYSFNGWNTNQSGTGQNYAKGASYTANAAATLYAKWTANTYAVKFNANGGSGAPANQTKTYGVNLTLSATKPTRTNYIFKGWATSASATTAQYRTGSNNDQNVTYTANSAVTLYAVWELAYVAPRVTNLRAIRCDDSGNAADEGTRCKLSFTYAVDSAVSATNYATVKAKIGSAAEETLVASSDNKTGTNTYSGVLAATGLNVNSSYKVTVTLTDVQGGSATATTSLSPAFFTIDVKSGGHGVAFGMPATLDNVLDIGMPIVRLNSASDGTGAIRFHGLNTTNGYDVLKFYSGPSSDGDEIVMQSGGQVIVGAGESGANLHTALAQGSGNEQLYLASDNNVYIHTQCNTIANRLKWQFSASTNAPYVYADCGAASAVTINTSTNNGVTANTNLGGYYIRDKNAYWTSFFGSRTGTSGDIWTMIGAHNKKADGTDVSNYIQAIVTKAGAQTYSISSPANFRSAIAAANAPTQLYNNTSGVTGNVTLSDSAANYNYLRIFFYGKSTASGSATKYECVEVYAPNGKIAQLSCTGQGKSGDLGVIFFSKMVTISAKAVSSTSYCSASIDSGGTTCAKNNEIYITRVEGWK